MIRIDSIEELCYTEFGTSRSSGFVRNLRQQCSWFPFFCSQYIHVRFSGVLLTFQLLLRMLPLGTVPLFASGVWIGARSPVGAARFPPLHICARKVFTVQAAPVDILPAVCYIAREATLKQFDRHLEAYCPKQQSGSFLSTYSTKLFSMKAGHYVPP